MPGRINPDYTEEIVGFALESYLTFISYPHRRFSIEPFSKMEEHALGADAALLDASRWHILCMQFKRPYALLPTSSSSAFKYRNRQKMASAPHALFFGLRGKKKHQTWYQHNVLLDTHNFLSQNGIGSAVYVCPLFLYRFHYRRALYYSAWWRRQTPFGPRPFDWEDIDFYNARAQNALPQRIIVPAFPQHIAFPPHAVVHRNGHRYSFSVAGTDLCFHSSEIVDRKPNKLGQHIMGEVEKFLSGEGGINNDNSNNMLEELVKRTESKFEIDKNAELPIDNWLKWGRFVREQYDIHQYAIIERADGGE